MIGVKKQALLLILFVLVIVFLLAAFSYKIYISEKDVIYVFDFFPRWHGAREILQGHNPYTEAMTRTVQDYMAFEIWQPYRHNFLYPATITYILLPFWLLPWEVSVSLWLGLTLTLWIILPLVVFSLLRWRIQPWLLGLVVFFSGFVFRHSMHTYLFGQFFAFIIANLVLAWWAIRENRPWLAAAALVLATVRPDGADGAILVGAVLVDLLLTRRFKIIAIWGTVMMLFLILSFVQIGWWVPDMMENVRGYRECCIYTEPADVLSLSPVLQKGYQFLIAAWAGVMLWQMRPLPDNTRIPWSLSVVMIAYLLIFTQSKDYTLTYGLLPAWIIIWVGHGRSLSTVLVLLILASPWLYHAMGWTLPQGHPVEQLVTPIILGVLLTIAWTQWRRVNEVTASSNLHPANAQI